ncbi:MAG: CapA family protein [Oscillospiraceae bacterium]|nr:CapA family protein [Oscillospiraceae bacterium]
MTQNRLRAIYAANLAAILTVLASALLLAVFWRVPGTNSSEGTALLTTTAPPAPPPSVVRLMAVGDNLIHDTIYEQAAARAAGRGYDFGYAYEGVRGLLSRADLSVINQESPITGAVARPSSYPLFSSPTQVGDAVYDLGFRAVNLSNNHMLDKGTAGVTASLDYWAAKAGVATSGAYRDEADFATPHVLEVNGVTFGFVGATYSFNGLQLPRGSELVLPLLEEEDRLFRAISLARANADVVVASLHWGTENSQETTEGQRLLARKAVGWGADVILGTHPHVLQGMEWLEKPGGGKAFVAYSLGNFISAQSKAPQLIGGVLELVVTKDNTDGAVTLSQPKFTPVITYYGAGYSNLRLVPWAGFGRALAESHGVRRGDARFSYDYCKRLLKETIPEGILDLTSTKG